ELSKSRPCGRTGGKDSKDEGGRRATECAVQQIARNPALGVLPREPGFIQVGAGSRVSAYQALLRHDLQLFQHGGVYRWPAGREVLVNLPDGARSVIPEHVEDIELRICRKACGRGRLASGHRNYDSYR